MLLAMQFIVLLVLYCQECEEYVTDYAPEKVCPQCGTTVQVKRSRFA